MLGDSAGGLHTVGWDVGALRNSSQHAADHEGPVTGLHAIPELRHFVAGGRDGMVKVATLPNKLLWPALKLCC